MHVGLCVTLRRTKDESFTLLTLQMCSANIFSNHLNYWPHWLMFYDDGCAGSLGSAFASRLRKQYASMLTVVSVMAII